MMVYCARTDAATLTVAYQEILRQTAAMPTTYFVDLSL